MHHPKTVVGLPFVGAAEALIRPARRGSERAGPRDDERCYRTEEYTDRNKDRSFHDRARAWIRRGGLTVELRCGPRRRSPARAMMVGMWRGMGRREVADRPSGWAFERTATRPISRSESAPGLDIRLHRIC